MQGLGKSKSRNKELVRTGMRAKGRVKAGTRGKEGQHLAPREYKTKKADTTLSYIRFCVLIIYIFSKTPLFAYLSLKLYRHTLTKQLMHKRCDTPDVADSHKVHAK